MIKVSDYPINKDRLEKLDRMVNEVYRPNWERLIENEKLYEPINGAPIGQFISLTHIFALHSAAIQKDFKLSRKWFYLSDLGRIRRYAEYKKDASSTVFGYLPNLWFFLSDANHLYTHFSQMRHLDEEYLETKASWISYQLFRLFQESLVKNWVAVRAITDKIDAREKYKNEIWLQERLRFYKALSNESSAAVESSLAQILSVKSTKKSNKAFKDSALGDFMCNPGMWYSKLAWICGHQIEIEHPLIVSELLTVQPLSNYDNPYSFLIDPVLEEASILSYGASHESYEVERHNQMVYQTKYNNSLKQKNKLYNLFNKLRRNR
jgi:hypothetical protein